MLEINYYDNNDNNYNLSNIVVNNFIKYIEKINNYNTDIGLAIFSSANLIRFNTIFKGLTFEEIKSTIHKYRMDIIINNFINNNKYVNNNDVINYYLNNIKDNYSCNYNPISFNKFVRDFNKEDIYDDDDGYYEELAIHYRSKLPTIEQLKKCYYRYNNNLNDVDIDNDYYSEDNNSEYIYSDIDSDYEESEVNEDYDEYYSDNEY